MGLEFPVIVMYSTIVTYHGFRDKNRMFSARLPQQARWQWYVNLLVCCLMGYASHLNKDMPIPVSRVFPKLNEWTVKWLDVDLNSFTFTQTL